MRSVPDPGFDQRIADWLKRDPDHAPAAVLETVSAAFPSIPQRHSWRLPWRFPTMLRLAAAAVVVVLAIGVVVMLLPRAGFGPAAQPSPTPMSTPGASSVQSPAPATSPFHSPTSTPVAGISGWIVFEHFGQAPDGSSPTFNADDRRIWLVHSDGSGLHELSPGTPVDGKLSPDISPDGRLVAFASWYPLQHVYTVPIDGGEPTLISTDCNGDPDTCTEARPAWSPDGTKLAMTREVAGVNGSSAEIVVRDLTTGHATELTATKVAKAQGYLGQISWSPDGTRIVYQRDWQARSEQHISNAQLYVVNADGSGVRKLSPGPETAHVPTTEWAADPDWSPDGSLIVYSRAPNRETEGWAQADGAPLGALYTIHPDGTGAKNICDQCLGGGWAPSWMPDGRIFFWAYQTWGVVNADGTNAVEINPSKLTWFGGNLGYGYAGFVQPTP